MKYPYFSNWVTYKKVPGKDLYHVRNHVLESQCYLNFEDLMFCRRLNGWRNPYSIKGKRGWYQTKVLLSFLEEYGVIRNDHGIIKIDNYRYMITLVRTGNSKTKRIIARFINTLRMALFMPLLVLGIYLYFYFNIGVAVEPEGIAKMAYEHPLIASLCIDIAATILGSFFHEISHAHAARSIRGGRVFEYGMILSFPPGFYTLMDSKTNSTLQEIGVLVAGVQGNILLAGLILIFGSVFWPVMRPFLCEAAVMNLIMACVNLSPFGSTDGLKILALVLGLDIDDIEKTKALIKNKKYRRKFEHEGITGCTKVAACYILSFLQLFFPMMTLAGIIMWIGVLFV